MRVLTVSPVGAMFYISPQLTLLMLAVVPPVSMGAVSQCSAQKWLCLIYLGVLWKILEEAFEQNTRSVGRNDEGTTSLHRYFFMI